MRVWPIFRCSVVCYVDGVMVAASSEQHMEAMISDITFALEGIGSPAIQHRMAQTNKAYVKWNPKTMRLWKAVAFKCVGVQAHGRPQQSVMSKHIELAYCRGQ